MGTYGTAPAAGNFGRWNPRFPGSKEGDEDRAPSTLAVIVIVVAGAGLFLGVDLGRINGSIFDPVAATGGVVDGF